MLSILSSDLISYGEKMFFFAYSVQNNMEAEVVLATSTHDSQTRKCITRLRKIGNAEAHESTGNWPNETEKSMRQQT